MDNEIIDVVNRILDFYSKGPSYDSLSYWVFSFDRIKRNRLIDCVLSKKDKFDPSKGNLNAYFSEITKRYLTNLYHRDRKRIKNRKIKIKTIYNGSTKIQTR